MCLRYVAGNLEGTTQKNDHRWKDNLNGGKIME
jgi:hypothetical protein